MREKKKQMLLELFDVCKYAEEIKDYEVFYKAQKVIYNQFIDYLSHHCQIDVSSEEFQFSIEQKEFIENFSRQICLTEDSFFTSSTLLFSIWFPLKWYVPLNDDTSYVMWGVITKAIETGRDEWIMRYWIFAEQHYRDRLDSVVQGDSTSENNVCACQKKRFKEFHIALQAYILYRQKYNLLKRVLNYSSVYPPKYNLTDNNLMDIIEHMEIFEMQRRNSGQLSARYWMTGVTDDVKADDMIYHIIASYLALLLYRLPKLNLTENNTYQKTEIQKWTINEVESKYGFASDLIEYFQNDFVIEAARKMKLYTQEKFDEVKREMNMYKSKLEKRKADLENNIEMDRK